MTDSTKQPKEPLTGDAAWQAAKREVSKRNEEAFARARAQRSTRDAAVRAQQIVADQRSIEELRERAERFG
jgi:hypothetical protein